MSQFAAQGNAIYEVQLTSEDLFAKLLDSKVNDWVLIGHHDNQPIEGCLCYKSTTGAILQLTQFEVYVEFSTKKAYFRDLAVDHKRVSHAIGQAKDLEDIQERITKSFENGETKSKFGYTDPKNTSKRFY